MTDLDPTIWDNKTLGAAAQNPRLDVIQKQDLENRNAKIEGREPREVVVENNYPGWQPDQNVPVPSNAQVVHFADEQPNDIPDSGVNLNPSTEVVSDESETSTVGSAGKGKVTPHSGRK
jgi:hypothetical protein